MSLETPKERLLYQGAVPILAAMAGAVAATWFQSVTFDNAQIADVITLLKDPTLSADQKLQALKMYQDITDRPWSVVRSLVTTLTMTISVAVGALVVGGFFNRRS